MFNTTRRRFIIGGSTVALSSILLKSVEAEQNKPVIWGPPAGPSIIAAYAIATGMIDPVLPGCTFKIWNSPDQIRAGFSSGSTTMAILPSYGGANLYNKGLGVRLANILTNGLLYVVAPESVNIKSLNDLIGKKLAVPFKDDMPDYVIQAILTAYGIALDAIDIHYAGSLPEVMPLLMTGRVDAAITVEPACSAIISMSAASPKKMVRALDIQELWNKVSNTSAIPQAGLFVGKEFSGTRGSEKITQINEIFSQALKEIKVDPEKASSKVDGVLDFPPHLIAASIDHCNLIVQNAVESRPSLENFFNVLMRQNPAILGGRLPDDGFYA